MKFVSRSEILSCLYIFLLFLKVKIKNFCELGELKKSMGLSINSKLLNNCV